MPKFEYESQVEVPSAFFERRRLRRVRMIVELTLNLISSDRTVSHREARYARVVEPYFMRVLQQRWPEEELRFTSPYETVN